MGQGGSTGGSKVRQRLETAQKTGCLALCDLKLQEVPPLPSDFPLRTLNLSNNRLTALPPSITAITSIKILEVKNNKLQSLPEPMGELKSLQSLHLDSNLLSALPPSIQLCASLKQVSLSHNALTELPEALCALPHLELLDLSSNTLTCVPAHVASLTATELNLDHNQVSQIHADIHKCPRLRTLRLEENCLSLESVPRQLLAESHVSLLCVRGNLFSEKQLQETDGYEAYIERYTNTKKKLF